MTISVVSLWKNQRITCSFMSDGNLLVIFRYWNRCRSVCLHACSRLFSTYLFLNSFPFCKHFIMSFLETAWKCEWFSTLQKFIVRYAGSHLSLFMSRLCRWFCKQLCIIGGRLYSFVKLSAEMYAVGSKHQRAVCLQCKLNELCWHEVAKCFKHFVSVCVLFLCNTEYRREHFVRFHQATISVNHIVQGSLEMRGFLLRNYCSVILK